MVEMTEVLGKHKIKKLLIKPGSGDVPPFTAESKAIMHFKAVLPKTGPFNKETILDDSRNFHQPFELLIGKSFKMACWEECIRTMKVGEVSRFSCPKASVVEYPIVSQSLRDLHHGKEAHGHQCGFEAIEKGYGYDDLNKWANNMSSLDFEIEFIKYVDAGSYEKELWQMNVDDMEHSIPLFHKKGNMLFNAGKTVDAEQQYSNALGCLKQLQMKQRPGTDIWISLDDRQIPLLLNYAQCKLNRGYTQECIASCTEVLEKLNGLNNVKALFKRGKAHANRLEEKECLRDWSQALKLNPTIKSEVDKELRRMDELKKERDAELSRNLKGMFNL